LSTRRVVFVLSPSTKLFFKNSQGVSHKNLRNEQKTFLKYLTASTDLQSLNKMLWTVFEEYFFKHLQNFEKL
jgi:hypothetical protein